MIKVKRVLGLIVIVALLISGSASFLVSMSPVVAQDTEMLHLAPLNPDFLDFLQQPSQLLYGYVPPTMDLSHLKEIPVQSQQALQALPATFDWRTQGKATPVKNQEPCGTCWLFGTLAAVESRVWIVDGFEYDFSEQNVACCLDPAWVYLIDNRCMGGGNSLLATDVLTKKGTRLEECDPYNTGTINTEVCNDACTTIKRITGYRLVADSSQITEVKNAVCDYGPVSMAYCHDNSYLYPGTIYYWPDCTEDANHMVCIVGWDDTIEWPGGAGNGAWIVKNSWGTGFGDAGYFYLCYGSANMEEVASYRYEGYDANETVYYWDEAGLVLGAGYFVDHTWDTSAWMASVFTSGQDGTLTHVDFWTTSNNATYELYVYDGSFGSQLAYQTGSCAEFGYYSIPLTSPVWVTNGQQFTVAVKMTTPGFNYPLPVEVVLPGICQPPIQTEVCFTRHLNSDLWDDAAGFADVGVNVCLRAKIGPASATDMGEIHSAETKTGNISSKGQTDSFTFNGEAGQTVIIQMSQESGMLDPQILLYDPYGSEETSASGAATALISNYQLLQTGLYTIVAKDDFGSDTGEYSLSLTKIPSTLPPGIYNPFPPNKATIANLGQSFTWDAVERATSYDLYFGENVTIPLEKIGENLPSPEMPFPEMVVDKVYYWHVEAYTPGGSIEGPYWWFKTSEAPPADILAYYRAYSGDLEVVETTDLLKAANDWANEVVPPGFTEPISTTQLLTLANEWAATG